MGVQTGKRRSKSFTSIIVSSRWNIDSFTTATGAVVGTNLAHSRSLTPVGVLAHDPEEKSGWLAPGR
ncbi:MAG: hypothetical protein JWL96_4665 [Sphingomonas bacterium]|jgi:hypothetical protein|nr:hypothetical protein [Sphingomonas bacterium]MEA2752478.1 hypothetical protein [Myxococcales bacterium]